MTNTKTLRLLTLICILAITLPSLAGAVLVNLGWTAPVTNEDDTPLEDLAGFNLYLRADTNFVPGQDVIITILEGVNPVPGPADEYTVEVDAVHTAWFTITAVDFAGNESVFCAPLLVDASAPVITLQGDSPLALEQGTPFAEPGFTADDDIDGDVTANVVVTGSVDHNTPGTYTLFYNVTDSSGNVAGEQTRIVNVASTADTTPPVITLQGSNPVTLEYGTPYSEPGFTATDNVDGNVTANVNVTGTVNHNALGTYQRRYNVADSSGNDAVERVRTVNVVDTTRPVITLAGANPMQIPTGVTYVEPGFTAIDNVDGNLAGQVIVTGSVNTSVPGTYTLRYNVQDGSGNDATEQSRLVEVVDLTSPIITLQGANPLILPVGTPYSEPGFAATDNVDGTLTALVKVSGSVDHNTLGIYELRYNVTDSSGNVATEKTRTVRVVDTSAPVISLVGANPVTLEYGTPYAEPGFSAYDEADGDLTSQVQVSGSVNHMALGSYPLAYNVADASGNDAVEVVRTVNVVDTTAPAITLQGDNPLTLQHGTAYNEPGFQATDGVDGDITSDVLVSGSVDENAVGTYELTYRVDDASGNSAAAVVRTVEVVDTTRPSLVLLGANPMDVPLGGSYVEPGYTASDNADGDLTGAVTITGTVDTDTLGTYSLRYIAEDSSGNTRRRTRTVNVVDTAAPVITLSGANPVILSVGTPYAEPGYSATDNADGDLTAQVQVTGTVDHNTAGTYSLRYNVSDGSGNAAAEKVRTVQVIDDTAPIVSLMGSNPMNLAYGVPYSEPGYTASDAADGDLTSQVQVSGSVDHTTVGTYSLRYNVSDSSGNAAAEAVRVVHVVDQVAPVISLLGDNPLTVAHGSTFAEPGYMATDDVDGGVTAQVQVTGAVNTGTPGTYFLYYNVDDSSGNDATQVTRTVHVVDQEAPVISLVGDNPVTLAYGVPYAEPGYSATDAADGDLTSQVQVSGSVDHNTVGTYQLRYNVSDISGNDAAQVTRTVRVVDSQRPEITLSGANPLDLQVGAVFSEPGYTATDDADGDLTGSVTVSGSVDTAAPGTYQLFYDVQDSSGNDAVQRVRTVRVTDVSAPVITLAGANPMVVYEGTSYVEPGFSATDDVDGDLTAQVQVTGTVDHNTLGTYLVRYNVSDSSGNAAVEQVRTVQVLEDPTEPPPDATPLSPTGLIEKSRSPQFSWEAVPEAEWYQVDIDKEGGDYYNSWYQTTNFTPTWDLAPGDYDWAVRTWNQVGMGNWSETAEFTIEAQIPAPPILAFPAGRTRAKQPTFDWADMEHARWYHLYVDRDGQQAINVWVEADSHYTVADSEKLRFGNYTWWVRGWGLDGMGEWSEGTEFQHGVFEPVAPIGDIVTTRPEFTWTHMPMGEWYQIWITRNGEDYYNLWLQDASWVPEWDLGEGDYSWWVRAWDEQGMSPWSSGASFTLPTPEP